MDIGKLNQRIQIQEATESRTDQGGVKRTWTTIATVWGSIEPVSGTEIQEAGATETRLTHRVRLRYRSDLTTKHRLVAAEP